MERARTTAKDEAAARTFLEDGKMEAKGLVELLAMIQKEGQMALYYSGGLSVVTNMLNDSEFNLTAACEPDMCPSSCVFT